ncbi:carbohydrate ABC transporter permease [Sphaerisporangium perillae]|uniref:carbohydrate ABC transporter permease n=1 Tax=Sphaerisporangium perillae TaxID=2935860 RepID=UPI00200D86FF|nr:sugar ABC transporter permease [Sphaerisporangium perillae]
MPQTSLPPAADAPAEKSAPPARSLRVRRLSGRDRLVLGLMVGVPTLIQAVLVWIPTLLSVGLSFMKWNGLNLADIRPAGLSNYTYAVQDYPPFWPAVAHNIIWLAFLALVATPIGLLLAVLLDQKIRGTRLYQSIFFAPVMLSMVMVGIVWQLVYARNEGLLNNLLGTAGTPGAVDWFGDSGVNLWAALVATTWRHAGYIMVLYLAGLKGIDPSLREAAAIDGSNAWQTFFRVVLPAMRPINIVIVVITIIEALRAFDIVYLINKGTNGLELLSVLVIQNLVGVGQVIGVGSALAVILLLISLGPIVYYLVRTFRRAD